MKGTTPIPFLRLLRQAKIPAPETELQFDPTRRWRFDYAWPSHRLALEVDGAIWVQGRHSRGSGLVKEHEKMNAAAVQGWRILRVQPKDLTNLATIRTIWAALAWKDE